MQPSGSPRYLPYPFASNLKFLAACSFLGEIMAFELVYTVNNYYDGPRSGIADYRGQPHRYDCQFDEEADDWTDTFVLTPVAGDTLALALEQWAIWRKWEAAFHAGKVPHGSHPAFGGQDERYDELTQILKRRLTEKSAEAVRAKGHFRVRPHQQDMPVGVMRELEVEWESVISI